MYHPPKEIKLEQKKRKRAGKYLKVSSKQDLVEELARREREERAAEEAAARAAAQASTTLLFVSRARPAAVRDRVVAARCLPCIGLWLVGFAAPAVLQAKAKGKGNGDGNAAKGKGKGGGKAPKGKGEGDGTAPKGKGKGGQCLSLPPCGCVVRGLRGAHVLAIRVRRCVGVAPAVVNATRCTVCGTGGADDHDSEDDRP